MNPSNYYQAQKPSNPEARRRLSPGLKAKLKSLGKVPFEAMIVDEGGGVISVGVPEGDDYIPEDSSDNYQERQEPVVQKASRKF